MSDASERDPRIVRGLWIAIGVLLLGSVVLQVTAPTPETVAAAEEGEATLEVRSLRLAPETRRSRALLSGLVEPRRLVRLVSETTGRVIELGAEDLDPVEQGQLLVAFDPLTAKIAVSRAEAAVARKRSELGLAKTSLGRQESLQQRSVASDSALDDAGNRSRVAQAGIRDARAALDEARDALEKKTLLAPFSGVLRGFDVELGEYVSVGQPLGELLDLSAARISVGLTDRQIVTVQRGEAVAVTIEAYPQQSFEGVILRVASAAQRDTFKFPVEIEVPNPDGRILPGMVARVSLDLGALGDRLLVPRESVGREFGLRFVFLLEDDGNRLRARRRKVEVRELPFDPRLLELVSGVRAGDTVAVSGLRELSDGAAVRTHAVVTPPAGDPS